MRRIIYALFISAILVSCATGKSSGIHPGDVWADSSLVAEQRLEIERLRNDIERMGELAEEISNGIDFVTARLISGIERSGNIEDISREIDIFVRAIIAENERLRSLQSADSRENAGAR